ncbi:LppU/SCO3897 family protein [Nocardia sp. NPDC003482]
MVAARALIARVRPAPVALALIAAAVGGCAVTGRSAAAGAAVGDCLEVTEGAVNQARTTPVDCASGRVVYTVVSTSDRKGDCGPEYSSYEETAAGETTAFLCLAPNLKADSCYHRDSATGFTLADCAAPEATVRVVARFDGRADRALCDPAATYLTLTEPATTFCFVNPRA